MCGPDTDGGHDHAASAKGGQRPDPDAFVRNMRTPMPAARKIRLVVRNNALKIARLQNCCGHPGEPGC